MNSIKIIYNQFKYKFANVTVQFILLLALYQITRLLFFVANKNLFTDVSILQYFKIMFYGVRFDTSAILIVNSLYFLVKTLPNHWLKKKAFDTIWLVIFVLLNMIGVLLNLIDIPYFQISHKRITFDFIHLISDSSNMGLLFSYIKSYWYLIVVIAVIGYVLVRIATYKTKLIMGVKTHWLVQLCSSCLIVVFVFVGARGGTQMRPITIANAAQYASSNNIGLVLNSTFTFINTSTNTGLLPVNYYTDSIAEKIYYPIHFLNHNKPFTNLNVVLIVLESFGKEYVGYYNKDKNATPFLDSLMRCGTVFNNSFANATRSIEGIPAIVASIPHLSDNAFITSSYSTNQITGIASLLNAQGYNSSFYHGGRNGTMSFDAFAKLSGYQNYYGLNEYKNSLDFDGHWGIWDEPYLQYFAQEINNKKQPFFATVFTLSSHDPYNIPEKYKTIFKEGKLPITKTIAYTDFALRQFFNKIKNKSWFKNTLFVLTADHTSITQNPYYQNSYGFHKIPIVFYQFNQQPKVCNVITQQIDILPNIMEYLHYDQSYFSFGKPTINNNFNNSISMHYIDGEYETFNDSQLVKFDTKKITSLFNLRKDSLIQINVLQSQKMNQNLLFYSKAFLQTYTHCMVENKMNIENYFRTVTGSSDNK